MPTGYEVGMYRDISQIARALQSIDRKLPDPEVEERCAKAESALAAIEEILYPNGDPDHEWSSNELEWVAEVIMRYRGSET